MNAPAPTPVPKKCFRFLGAYDVADLAQAVIRHAERFRDATWRQAYPGTAHKDTESIYLRMPPMLSAETLFHSRAVANLPLYDEFAFRHVVRHIAHVEGLHPARAMIVNLKAGGHVTPHIDQGRYSEGTERYHLPIVSDAAVTMTVGGETQHLAVGDIWWFDKHQTHEVHNRSKRDRLHLILDLFRFGVRQDPA